MVAYSFQPMFVDPIRMGLGLIEDMTDVARPKRQTIRATGKKRHARPGEIVQLYCQMRTPQCMKIGDGRCTGVAPIVLQLSREPYVEIGKLLEMPKKIIQRADALDFFATQDGFADWAQLREFWAKHHPRVSTFRGVIIFWEPVPPAEGNSR